MSRSVDVAGPFDSENEAISTMNFLGFKNHSYYSVNAHDEDKETQWFVERLLDVSSGIIFGEDESKFLSRQYK